MTVKKKLLLVILCLAAVLLNVLILVSNTRMMGKAEVSITMSADVSDNVQLFYSPDGGFSEDMSSTRPYAPEGNEEKTQVLEYTVSGDMKNIRLDLGEQAGTWIINDITVSSKDVSDKIGLSVLGRAEMNDIASVDFEGSSAVIKTNGGDPFLIVPLEFPEVRAYLDAAALKKGLLLKIAALVFVDGLLAGILIFRKKVMALPLEIIQNRALIFQLAKNDFKTRYAGSYLGIIWAFIQPIVTILVYWFVFSVGFRSGTMDKVPFVLYLIGGIVPWFYFQDTLNSGTNSLIEYSYLVKKVVFKISVLPMVKAISAFFVHAFFVLVTLVIYTLYGIHPTPYTLQIIYYFICMFVFVLGICYGTSAIVIFFRDLTQLINIVLQVGVWSIPIMWDINVVPESIRFIFRINPMYYVINGYRDALYNGVWFWQYKGMTLYFWVVTAVLFGIGTFLFKKLKVHFADVL